MGVTVVVGSLEEAGFMPVVEPGSVPQSQPVFSSTQQVSAAGIKHLLISEVLLKFKNYLYIIK